MSSHIQETLAATANKVTGAGSAVTLFSWFNSSNFGMWAGIAIGLIGLAINLYYKRKSDRRAIEAHALYMSKNAMKAALDSLPPIQDPEESERVA